MRVRAVFDVQGFVKMRCQTFTDRLRRITISNNEPLRKALRFITHSPELPLKTRMLAQFKLTELPAVTAETRVNRRCTESGWGRSVISEFNLARNRFRDLALDGKLRGVKKASW